MILVTGASGFIGSNIAAALARRGARLALCDRHPEAARGAPIPPAAVAHRLPAEELMAWLRGRRGLEAVIHMGAVTSTSETDVDLVLRTNVWLPLMLWDWCAGAGVPLIWASSAQVYGDGGQGFDDDPSQQAMARLRPITPYGAGKLLFDRLAVRERDAGRPTPPHWAGLRFCNVYGPWEDHKGEMRSVIAKSVPALRAGGALRLFRSERPGIADGGQKRDFIHVEDCVAAVLWLLGRPDVAGIFNLGTGRARSWLELAHAVFAALGRPPAIDFIDMPAALKGRYQYFTQAGMARLRRAGYRRPFTGLEEGVADYVQGHLLRRLAEEESDGETASGRG